MKQTGLPYCPFFKKEEGNKIYCELATFRCPDKRSKEQVKTLCCDEEKYKTCPLCQVLDDYYTRKYKGEGPKP
jgi:hypothetical protein